MSAAATEVARMLREADRDAYVAALYAPEPARRALMALAAFGAETASVRERAREPLPGEIRLQWWRDTIGQGGPSGNPVADELLAAMERHALPPAPFMNLLDARLFDLYDDPMPDRAALEAYCGETASAMIQLACMVIDRSQAPAWTEASGHAGCALALSRIVARLPIQRARGQCYVPADLLAAAGISRDTLLSADPGAGGARAAAAMIALGREHVAAFEAKAKGMPAGLRPAFLPAATAPLLLSRAARMGERLLLEPATVSPLRRQWAVWRRAARGWG